MRSVNLICGPPDARSMRAMSEHECQPIIDRTVRRDPYLRSSRREEALTYSRHDRSASLAAQPVQPSPVGPSIPQSAFRNPHSTVAAFFLNHRGRCFEGWSDDKIDNYVLVNLLHQNVFAARYPGGALAIVAIGWLADAATVIRNAECGLPQFDWEHPKGWTPNGDSILVAEVAGDRKAMPEILKQVMARWPDSPRKRLFTYRRGKLVELSWQTAKRFSELRIADCGLRITSQPHDQPTIGNHSAFRIP